MNFQELANYFLKLENTPKRLQKIEIISEILKKASDQEVEAILVLLQGRVYPIWSMKKLGIAEKMIQKAVSSTFGISIDTIERKFAETGDLGTVAQRYSGDKKQQTLDMFNTKQILEITTVFETIRKISEIQGSKGNDIKTQLIASLLSPASALESKYLVRILLEDLRIGISVATIRDAIIQAFTPKIGITSEKNLHITKIEEIMKENLPKYTSITTATPELETEIKTIIRSSVELAYDKLNDLYKITKIITQENLEKLQAVPLEPLTPLRVMLMQRVKTITEAVEKIPLPFQLEYKYDGFRCQIHKKGDVIHLFTRNLENITPQFPDIIELAKKNIDAKEAILDGEILGIDKKSRKFLPFQEISQRIKRKYNIHEMISELPVVYASWDILFLNGVTTIDMPLEERRILLEKTIQSKNNFFCSNRKLIHSIEDGEKYYTESLKLGNEGVVVKDLHAKYQPGNRVGCWLKIKPIMDPLDLVITSAQWGEGKRANWLTSYVLSCRAENGEYKTIGKVASGLKEKEDLGEKSYTELTQELLALKNIKIPEKNKTIAIIPKIIISVAYEEIQKSPTYSSGYALRFPRILAIRDDLSLEDVEDLKTIEASYLDQRK